MFLEYKNIGKNKDYIIVIINFKNFNLFLLYSEYLLNTLFNKNFVFLQ